MENRDIRKKDILYIVPGIILLFIYLLPQGPLGFLPLNIALFIAIILTSGWFKRGLDISEKIERKKALIEYIALVSLFVFWFLIKVFSIHPSTTDENIYFYMAKRFSEGLIPYRDFFFAHPPIHLIIPAIIFKFTGFNLIVAKLIPITASLISGIYLYKFLKTLSGPVLGFAGVIYYLFSYQILMASSDMTGINLTIMFLSMSVYYLFTGREIISGILSALSISTGIYSTAFVVSTVFYLLISKELKRLMRYLISFIIPLLMIFGTFYIIAREDFVTQVFKYHIMKPDKIQGQINPFTSLNPFIIIYSVLLNSINFLFQREFLKAIYFHSMLFIPFALSSIFYISYGIKDLLHRQRLNRPPYYSIYKAIGFSTLSFCTFIAEYGSLKEVYDFYLVFLFYFMSIGASYTIKYLSDLPNKNSLFRSISITLAVIALLWMYRPLSDYLDRPLFGEDIRKEGERIEYTYNQPHFPPAITEIARILYYKDHRIAGKTEPFYRHYIWNKNLSFEKAYEIASYVRSNTKEFETIAGASTIAPLIALLADRHIAAEEIDTNAKRFKSGLLSDEDFFRKVCSDNLKFLIITDRAYFSKRYLIHSDFLKYSFTQDKRFIDPSAQHFRPLEIYLYKPLFQGCGLIK